MKHAGPLLCLVTSVIGASTPRGVGPEFLKFYKNTETFTCISNPTLKIPFTQVNDDYCDCPDGSDEPGTAACAHLSPLSPRTPADISLNDGTNSTIALPGFYCQNRGHLPLYLSFTAVNDGVCDYDLCCDGSDEWQGIVQCEDKCDSIGKEAMRLEQDRQKALTAAISRRKELVTTAARLRKENEIRMNDLQILIVGSESKLEKLQAQLQEAERTEKSRVARTANGGKSGEIALLVGQAKSRTIELRETLGRVRQQRDTAKNRLDELEKLLSTFKEEYNPNFNDEGVKRAVRAWEDYSAQEKTTITDEGYEKDLDEIVKTDEESGLDWESFLKHTTHENPELDLLYSFEAYLPIQVRGWIDNQLRSLRQTLVEKGVLVDPSTSTSPTLNQPPESKVLSDARSAVAAVEAELNGHNSNKKTHQDDLSKDYGPDDVFRSLVKQCVSTEAGEYIYEVCFMDKTVQKPKKGGSHTGMGNFVGFETVDVDDGPAPANGKGLGTGKRLAMKYENGQNCWNGPNRSTMVIMACAEKDELWKITEEEKCVYRMEVGTPAVCGFDGDKGPKVVNNNVPPTKDEL